MTNSKVPSYEPMTFLGVCKEYLALQVVEVMYVQFRGTEQRVILQSYISGEAIDPEKLIEYYEGSQTVIQDGLVLGHCFIKS